MSEGDWREIPGKVKSAASRGSHAGPGAAELTIKEKKKERRLCQL